MKPILFFTFIALFASGASGASEFTQSELARIGHKVWDNECEGSVAGLTSWNEGENFASLGIGHFIWYPKNQRGPFEESFPKLVRFLAARGEKPPAWVAAASDCPWNSRAEFLRDAQSERMKTLRSFLVDTIPSQAAFLVERMQQALPKMLAEAGAGKREKVQREFERLRATPRGAFALIDYVNFKGEGTLATERYQGEGWGLLQVLEQMSDLPDQAVDDFADSAEEVLTRRVRNAPPECHEERWLPGWKNRVRRYTSEWRG